MEPYYRVDLALLSYLSDALVLDRALVAIARALKPGGALVIDVCNLEWGRAREGAAPSVVVEDDWVIVTRFQTPRADRFVREMTTFVVNDSGTWRRDDERHENVLIDTARLPSRLGELGVDARIASSFGGQTLPRGLVAVIGERRV